MPPPPPLSCVPEWERKDRDASGMAINANDSRHYPWRSAPHGSDNYHVSISENYFGKCYSRWLDNIKEFWILERRGQIFVVDVSLWEQRMIYVQATLGSCVPSVFPLLLAATYSDKTPPPMNLKKRKAWHLGHSFKNTIKQGSWACSVGSNIKLAHTAKY